MAMTSPKPFRLRSFVRRDSRITAAQARAHAEAWPNRGLRLEDGMIAYDQVFGRSAPCYLEIGFGSGQSLLALAKEQPEKDFIGVETHKPGIGALLLGVQSHALTNIRVYHGDVVDVLSTCIPNASLDGVQIFFPDPWPKRRHHARRLIQTVFIDLLADKLKSGGIFYLATDWEDYAKHMMQVLTPHHQFANAAGHQQFAERSPHRPILTKFERRAEREGRKSWDLCFVRSSQ